MASAAGLKIQPSMVVTIIVVLVLMAGSFLPLSRPSQAELDAPGGRLSASAAATCCLLVFGVFLQPAVTQVLGMCRMHGCRTATTAIMV